MKNEKYGRFILNRLIFKFSASLNIFKSFFGFPDRWLNLKRKKSLTEKLIFFADDTLYLLLDQNEHF